MSEQRDFVAVALDYARRAALRVPWAQPEVVGKYTRLACERQLADLERAESDPDWPFYFDPWHVEDVCEFVELLPHVEGEWDSPTIVLEPFQVFILACVFGWRRKSDGHRRFDTVYIEVARKNAKSALSSAVALYCLTCEGEKGPQVKTAATTGSQARIVFDVAAAMADACPDLCEEFGLDVYANSIVCGTKNGGTVKPINSKASTQDGLNPHLSILDELHAHASRKLFDVLRSARGARKNPLSWYITTAGDNVEGVCYEQRRIVTRILSGDFEGDHYFGIIYALDVAEVEGEASDDPLDESVWRKANPMLGKSVSVRELRGYAAEAALSGAIRDEFATKRMSIWLGARGAYLDMAKWKLGDVGELPLDELRNVPCYAGLDLASVQDATAFVMVWRIEGLLFALPRFFVPEEAVDIRTDQRSTPYRKWHQDGHLFATPGNVTDYDFVEKQIEADADEFTIAEIGYDTWNSSDLTNRLDEKGLPLVQFRQGIESYNPPMRALQRYAALGNVRTGANPMLQWMAGNMVARSDPNDNVAPDRKKSGDKIDGAIGLLEGLGRLMVAEGDLIEVPEGYEVLTA